MALSKITNSGIGAIDTLAVDTDTLYVDSTNNNVGIGTTSPSADLNVASSNATIHLTDTDDTTYAEIRNNGGTLTIGSDVGQAASNSSINFRVDNSEAMRVDSSGNLLVGTASATGSIGKGVAIHFTASVGAGLELKGSNTGGTFSSAIFRDGNGTDCGSIDINATANTTAYTTSSDHRLKENDVDMTGAITRVKQLQPKRFNFISDPDDTTVDGFMAHEVQTIVPEAITGTHNEVDDEGNPVYQGIDQSKLVPLLTGALQEAIAKIETLETEMTALKARVTALENA